MFQKKNGKKIDPVILVLGIMAGILALLIVVMLLLIPKKENIPQETTAPETTVAVETESTTETAASPTEATTEEGEPVMLPKMAELYAQNPDIVGWIKMEGTKLDDPVMFTPEDEEKYIYADFEEKFDPAGLPFIDKDCTLDPESKNVIIYGHNMLSGKMFAGIMKYENKDFFKAHPTFTYSTLYEEREYEIFAAFYDKIYEDGTDQFEFYYFVDPQAEDEFNEGIQYFKEKSRYDTGITPTFDDQLLMLVTCSYQTENGRFVVVAREKQ